MADIVLQTSQHGDQTQVAVIGALEGAAARRVQHHLRRVIDSSTPPRLVIDLRCCTGIDTHGILTLTATHQAVAVRGGTLNLAAVPPLIQARLEQEPGRWRVGATYTATTTRNLPESPVNEERTHMAEERERIADERERVADERERVADERERIADQRAPLLPHVDGSIDRASLDGWEREAVARENAADARDGAAEARDRQAEARARAAQQCRGTPGAVDPDGYERDRAAHGREIRANRREREANQRERIADRRDRETLAGASDPEVAEAFLQVLLERADLRDQRAEARDRAAEQRDTASRLRGNDTAHARRDRGAAAVDRMCSGEDRDQAAADRADLVDLVKTLISARARSAADNPKRQTKRASS